MVDVVTELTREGVLSKLLYAEDLVLMSETTDEMEQKWKEAF